jgi:DNA-binding CsgD family transcriptional regulator
MAPVTTTRPFVGRAGELVVLADHFDAGRGGVVLVRGVAGVGKKSLVTAALTAIPDNQATVLSTVCDIVTSGVAYGAVRRLFAPLKLELGSPLMRGRAAQALPALVQQAGTPLAKSQSYTVLEGLNSLAVNLTSGSRLVLAVNDAQWCDEESLTWLGFLIRRAAALVVLTQRTGSGLPRPGAVLADLIALPNCHVLEVGPLSDDGVAELTAEIMGVEPDERFTRQCMEITGGHPPLLGRLLGELRAAGTMPDEHGVTRVATAGRPIVTASVLESLARVSPEARAVAMALAVLGFDDDELVAALAGVSGHVLALAMHELRGDRILAGAATAFRHGVVRAAVLDTCQPEELTTLRRKAAMLLNETGRSAEDIAELLLLLPAMTEPWMLGVLRDAATSAESRGAPTSGARYLARALEIDQTDTSIRLDMARMLMHAEPTSAVGHLEEALALIADPRERAPIASRLAMACLAVGRSRRAAALLSGLLDELDAVIGPTPVPADQELRMEAELALLISGVADTRTSRHVIERVRTMRVPAGDTLAGRRLLGAVAAVGALDGRPAGLVVKQAESAVPVDNAVFGDRPLLGSVVALCLADRISGALQMLDRLLWESQMRGQRWAYQVALGMRAFVSYWAGRLPDAVADASAAVEVAKEVPWRADATLPHIVLAAALARRRDPAEAERVLDMVCRADVVACTLEHHWLLVAEARIRQSLGDTNGALALLRQCGDSLANAGIGNPVFTSWWLDAACVLADLGRHGEGMELVEQVEERAERWGTARAKGMVLMARGVCTPDERAVPLLAESVRTFAGTPARLELARAEYELGRASVRQGSVKDAREHFRRSIDLSALSGDRSTAAVARRSLAAAGGRVRAQADSPLEILTKAERRVAELAAAGQTNQSIAQTLFLAVRTVEAHLSNVYRKLGVAGRSDLSGALRPEPPRGFVTASWESCW